LAQSTSARRIERSKLGFIFAYGISEKNQCLAETESCGSAPLLRGHLAPRQQHARWPTVAITTHIWRAVSKPVYETHQLFEGFFVSAAAFVSAGQGGSAEDPGFGVAAGPGNER